MQLSQLFTIFNKVFRSFVFKRTLVNENLSLNGVNLFLNGEQLIVRK